MGSLEGLAKGANKCALRAAWAAPPVGIPRGAPAIAGGGGVWEAGAGTLNRQHLHLIDCIHHHLEQNRKERRAACEEARKESTPSTPPCCAGRRRSEMRDRGQEDPAYFSLTCMSSRCAGCVWRAVGRSHWATQRTASATAVHFPPCAACNGIPSSPQCLAAPTARHRSHGPRQRCVQTAAHRGGSQSGPSILAVDPAISCLLQARAQHTLRMLCMLAARSAQRALACVGLMPSPRSGSGRMQRCTSASSAWLPRPARTLLRMRTNSGSAWRHTWQGCGWVWR